jgi:hypothetical protein
MRLDVEYFGKCGAELLEVELLQYGGRGQKSCNWLKPHQPLNRDMAGVPGFPNWVVSPPLLPNYPLSQHTISSLNLLNRPTTLQWLQLKLIMPLRERRPSQYFN